MRGDGRTSTGGLRALVAVLVLTAALVTAPAAHGTEVGASSVHLTVEGPVPSAHPEEGGTPAAEEVEATYPFFALAEDYDAFGYVEEEHFLSGVADAYHVPTQALVSEGHPYTTRILVRRPVDPQDFNGTVLVEWQNATAGFDIDAVWGTGQEHLMREGYAFVAVTAQQESVDFLRGWSETRYGGLDTTDGGAVQGERSQGDTLAFDIFTQAGELVASPAGAALLGGAEVDLVLGIGASQSAQHIQRYYNGILPTLGESPFAGFLPMVTGSPATVENPFRADLGLPVFQVIHEADARGDASPQPDSDLYRRWEVTGSTHSPYLSVVRRSALLSRDLGADVPPEDESRIPTHHVHGAAVDHMVRWAAEGTPPPTADLIERVDGEIQRDEEGFALGGIRLSQVEVPLALDTADGHVPFTEEEIRRRHHSHTSYVAAVLAVDAANVASGYITAAFAEESAAEAARSDVLRLVPVDVGPLCAGLPPEAPFGDIGGSTFEEEVRCLAHAGITRGVRPGVYAPTRVVTRQEMASFIARLIDAAVARAAEEGTIAGLPDHDGTNRFTDVAQGNVHLGAINRLAAVDIVLGGLGGASADRYGPAEPLSRAQMASYVERALAFMTAEPRQAFDDYFIDDDADAHEPAIDVLAGAGIGVGDGEERFHPAAGVTRGQMSAFLVRSLSTLHHEALVTPLAAG
jgi:hypothetical protein